MGSISVVRGAQGIDEDARAEVFDIVAAVLLLGDVTFAPVGAGDAEASRVAGWADDAEDGDGDAGAASRAALEAASKLLGVDAAALAEALTTRVRQVGAETVVSPNTPPQAAALCDALSKARGVVRSVSMLRSRGGRCPVRSFGRAAVVVRFGRQRQAQSQRAAGRGGAALYCDRLESARATTKHRPRRVRRRLVLTVSEWLVG